MSFLSAGRKYQDIIVSASNKRQGKISFVVPDRICENAAPDMAKKKPAYAHSLSNGDLGISIAITPRSFHVPNIVKK